MNKEFKLIVAGGRSFVNRQLMDESIKQTIAELPDQYSVSIVSGMAKGADQLGHEWALPASVSLLSTLDHKNVR